MYKRIVYILIVSSIWSCKKNNDTSIKDYYYPYEKIAKNGSLIYEYHSLNDSFGANHWKFSAHTEENGAFIMDGIYYEDDGQVQQHTQETIISKGVFADSIQLFSYDTLGNQYTFHGNISASKLFGFEIKPGDEVFFQVSFEGLPPDNATSTLSRYRHFVGDTSITVFGKTYECLRFETRELYDQGTDEEGYVQPMVASKEYFAKGVGLVYYEKQISDRLKLQYGLYATQEE